MKSFPFMPNHKQPKPRNKVIGKNLKKFRKEQNLTQSQLAQTVSTTQQNIGRIEQGKTLPPIDTLELLAEACKTSMPHIYNDDDCKIQVGIHLTPFYIDRMEKESPRVQEIMKKALAECENEMDIALEITEREFEIYKTLEGDYKNPMKFWEFIDEFGARFSLDAPSLYVAARDIWEEENGSVHRKEFAERFVRELLPYEKCYGKVTKNLNSPFLPFEDSLIFCAMVGGIDCFSYINGFGETFGLHFPHLDNVILHHWFPYIGEYLPPFTPFL